MMTTGRALVGAQIAQARRAAGLSQRELAERLGVTQPRIAEWEGGVRCPSAAARRGIAAALAPSPVQHVPGPLAAGLSGEALCGEIAEYRTGDHQLIRNLALAAVAASDAGHWCPECLAALRADERED